jgi:hypothetical protein
MCFNVMMVLRIHVFQYLDGLTYIRVSVSRRSNGYVCFNFRVFYGVSFSRRRPYTCTKCISISRQSNVFLCVNLTMAYHIHVLHSHGSLKYSCVSISQYSNVYMCFNLTTI